MAARAGRAVNGRGMTHAEIAAVLGITRGGVFMAEKAALEKCRRICRARNVRFEDLCEQLKIDRPDCAVEPADPKPDRPIAPVVPT
jgi:hypothetical protein